MNPNEEPLRSLLKEQFTPVPRRIGIPKTRPAGTMTIDQEYDLARRNGMLLGDTPEILYARRRWLHNLGTPEELAARGLPEAAE